MQPMGHISQRKAKNWYSENFSAKKYVESTNRDAWEILALWRSQTSYVTAYCSTVMEQDGAAETKSCPKHIVTTAVHSVLIVKIPDIFHLWDIHKKDYYQRHTYWKLRNETLYAILYLHLHRMNTDIIFKIIAIPVFKNTIHHLPFFQFINGNKPVGKS